VGGGRAPLLQRGVDEAADDAVAVHDYTGDLGGNRIAVTAHGCCEEIPPLDGTLPPDVFNAYQQTQGEKLEKTMKGAGCVASFIGHEPGKALFVGLYTIGASKPLTHGQYWQVPAYVEMKAFGMQGFGGKGRSFVLWFDLALTDFTRRGKASWLSAGRLPSARGGVGRIATKFPSLRFSKTARSSRRCQHGTRSR
jgi:hypothetical protein